MNFESGLSIVDKFITWITLKKAFMLFLAGIVGIVLYSTFAHRADLVDYFVAKIQPQKSEASEVPKIQLELTPDVIARIKEVVDKSATINYLGVVAANIRINQRELAYFYSSDPIITRDMANSNWHTGSTQSIFTSSDKNNEQMVSVINGEFGCYKYEDTINFVMAPMLGPKMPYVCRVSLPPYYGEFSGYIAFGLKQKPDDSTINEIRIEAVRLATEIYFKTFAKGRKN